MFNSSSPDPSVRSSANSRHSRVVRSEAQSQSLSAFDYEQMYLALVILAERLSELKQKQTLRQKQYPYSSEGEYDESF